MLGSVGVPELLVVAVALVFWLLPLIAAVWAIVTLYRIRADQQVVVAKLEAIERHLRT